MTSTQPCPWRFSTISATVIKFLNTSPCGCQGSLRNVTQVGQQTSTCTMLFIVGLRLPLTELHRQLANYLGLFVSQITSNMWRIFIGVEVIWDQLSGGNRCLTPEFYYYRPQQIHLSKGIYHFLAGKPSFKLVSDMPDSNRNWKNRYFFVQGMD